MDWVDSLLIDKQLWDITKKVLLNWNCELDWIDSVWIDQLVGELYWIGLAPYSLTNNQGPSLEGTLELELCIGLGHPCLNCLITEGRH